LRREKEKRGREKERDREGRREIETTILKKRA